MLRGVLLLMLVHLLTGAEIAVTSGESRGKAIRRREPTTPLAPKPPSPAPPDSGSTYYQTGYQGYPSQQGQPSFPEGFREPPVTFPGQTLPQPGQTTQPSFPQIQPAQPGQPGFVAPQVGQPGQSGLITASTTGQLPTSGQTGQTGFVQPTTGQTSGFPQTGQPGQPGFVQPTREPGFPAQVAQPGLVQPQVGQPGFESLGFVQRPEPSAATVVPPASTEIVLERPSGERTFFPVASTSASSTPASGSSRPASTGLSPTQPSFTTQPGTTFVQPSQPTFGQPTTTVPPVTPFVQPSKTAPVATPPVVLFPTQPPVPALAPSRPPSQSSGPVLQPITGSTTLLQPPVSAQPQVPVPVPVSSVPVSPIPVSPQVPVPVQVPPVPIPQVPVPVSVQPQVPVTVPVPVSVQPLPTNPPRNPLPVPFAPTPVTTQPTTQPLPTVVPPPIQPQLPPAPTPKLYVPNLPKDYDIRGCYPDTTFCPSAKACVDTATFATSCPNFKEPVYMNSFNLECAAETQALWSRLNYTGTLPQFPYLSTWADTPIKWALLDFISRVTNSSLDTFVPRENRVANFDNDGTMWVEYPVLPQTAFLQWFVKRFPDPGQILQNQLSGYLDGTTRGDPMSAVLSGLSVDMYNNFIRLWVEETRHPTWPRPYTDMVFSPMVELFNLMQATCFNVFIVSGGENIFMRALIPKIYGIAPQNIIGSFMELKYEEGSGPGGAMEFKIYPRTPVVVDRALKPVAVQRNIGRVPIFAFGNSDGDFELLTYATTGPGLRMGVLLKHDDGIREVNYDGHLTRSISAAPQRGWMFASMKRDWKEVFGYTRTATIYTPRARTAAPTPLPTPKVPRITVLPPLNSTLIGVPISDLPVTWPVPDPLKGVSPISDLALPRPMPDVPVVRSIPESATVRPATKPPTPER